MKKSNSITSICLFLLLCAGPGAAISGGEGGNSGHSMNPLQAESSGKSAIMKQIALHINSRNQQMMGKISSADLAAAYAGVDQGGGDNCIDGDEKSCLEIYEQIKRNMQKMLSVSMRASYGIRAFNPMAVPYSKKLTVSLLKMMEKS